jgi:copper chaperone CopZ
MMTKQFKISGMHCTSCAFNIDGELEDTDGIKEARTSYAKAILDVKFDQDKINEDQIIKIIKKVGYEANVVN